MSNSVTGTTFAHIIDRVVNSSQNDFEESGVDQQTLQEMKEIWQKKLSALHVAQMPWDPAPPPPQISNPPTVPSNDAKPIQSQVPPSTSAPPNPSYGGVRVKQEPGYEQNYGQMNGYSGMNGGNIAQQRAAALLQQNFGAQAQASIASAYPQQNNVTLPGQQQRQMNLQLPQNRQHQVQQAQQQSPQQQTPSQQPQQHQSSVYAAQTDGAGDAEEEWKALIAARRAHMDDGPEGRVAMDGMLRAQLEARADLIESGLMMPLEELSSARNKKRKARVAWSSSHLPVSSVPSTSNLPSIPQLDGELDDDVKEENDDEAINSDLDDSEEEILQNDDDEGPQGDTMICTYDKVQRVKNKWKCTLKDGVLSTGGRDYLFHKAQGEFEW